MIVVSDTTPVRHLIAISQADLLPALYGIVILPVTVWTELHAEATPVGVKQWLAQRPAWLEVRSCSGLLSTDPDLDALDPGERAAIELASEIRADLLLIDDREGRSFALRRNLPVIGTLGVLERADAAGLLQDFLSTLFRLEESGFYISAQLHESMVSRYRLRHGIDE